MSRILTKLRRKEEAEKEQDYLRRYIEEVVERALDERLGDLEETLREAARREASTALKEQASLLGMQFVRLGDLLTEIFEGMREQVQGNPEALEKLKKSYSAGVRLLGEISQEIEDIEDKLSEIREAKEWIEEGGRAITEIKGEISRINASLKEMEANYNDLKERLKKDLIDEISTNILAIMIKYGILKTVEEHVVNQVLLMLGGGKTAKNTKGEE